MKTSQKIRSLSSIAGYTVEIVMVFQEKFLTLLEIYEKSSGQQDTTSLQGSFPPFCLAKISEYEECYKVLGAMVKFRCKKGCRNGGGSPFCKSRICAQKKGLEGCWLCEKVEGCKKLEFLVPVHGDAHIKNL